MSQRFILGHSVNQKWKCPQSCSFDMQNIEEGICSPPLGFQIGRSEIDFAILFLICWMHFMAMAAFSPSHPDLELALWLKVSLPSIDQFCFQGNENTPEPFWESVCKEDLGLFSLFPPLSSLLASPGWTPTALARKCWYCKDFSGAVLLWKWKWPGLKTLSTELHTLKHQEIIQPCPAIADVFITLIFLSKLGQAKLDC